MYKLRSIPGYGGLYSASSSGFIYSHARDRCLLGCYNCGGYLQVKLYKNGKHEMKSVHRLVILSFKGPSALQVNHKDGVKVNNTLTNLEYCTPQENTLHAIENGLFGSYIDGRCKDMKAYNKKYYQANKKTK